MSQLRIAMVLAGVGRVRRGAEAAFLELARHLGAEPGTHVELFGSGADGLPSGVAAHVTPCRPRESFEGWPRMPGFRTECYYEEFSYAWNLARSGAYRPGDFDVVLSCSYPWVNWYLRWAGRRGGPLHVYVTENGDWPCSRVSREYRYFGCDGLVCTNPVYYERQKGRYPTALIPNGVDTEAFHPAEGGERGAGAGGPRGLDVPPGMRLVVMASALISSKDVAGGVRAVAATPGAFLAVAGDGPQRQAVSDLARDQLPGRHVLLGSIPRSQMPALFRRADAFLHMSRDEPSALVYLEAAASGLPMVVHDWDVTRWTLGDTAFFTDTADTAATAAALREALAPAAASYGRAARQRVVEDWSWSVLAGRYRSFLLELLRNRTPVVTAS